MKRNVKSVTAFILILVLLAASPIAVYADTASSGTITGNSTVDTVVLNVLLPTSLNFALDPLSLGTAGDNQIATKDFFFVNQSFAPVKVAVNISAQTSGSAVIVATTGGLKKNDTTETSKKLYFGMLGAKSITGTAITAAAVQATDEAITASSIYTNSHAEYTTVTALANTLVALTPNSGGTTGSAVIAFALQKAKESSTTPDAITGLADNDKGVAAFQFYSELNTYADWKANDITVSGSYTLTPLRDTTYTGYSYVSNSMNQLVPEVVAPSTYSITVENDGHGTASASVSTAAAGDTVTLTATPSAGYLAATWTSTPSALVSGSSFTMPASNVTVKANFAAPDVTLTSGSATASYSFSMPTKFADSASGVKIGLTGAAGTTITSATWGAGVDVKAYVTLSNGVATLYANSWKAANAYSGTLTIVADGKTYIITTLSGTNP